MSLLLTGFVPLDARLAAAGTDLARSPDSGAS
jgi:hypothetical protein